MKQRSRREKGTGLRPVPFVTRHHTQRDHNPRHSPLQRAAANRLGDASALAREDDFRGARQVEQTALKAGHRKGAA